MITKELLKKNGFRLTKPRLELIKTISSYPLSVKDIYLKIRKKGITIDLVSIYRSLQVLIDLGLIRLVDFGDGKKRYELIHEKEHHHHIVCYNCGIVDDVEIEKEHTMLYKIEAKTNFKIEKHMVEFFGLCYKCQ